MSENVQRLRKYRGTNERKVNSFIEEMVFTIKKYEIKHARTCIKEFGYPHNNLLYRERQMYSLMSAAIHNITPIHQSESWVVKTKDRRNPKNRNRPRKSGGRCDLWAYNDGIEFYFEFKRSYVSVDNVMTDDTPIPAVVARPWKSLHQQVSEVRRTIKEDGGGENACCVGLHVITPYRSSKNKENLLDCKNIESRCIKAWMKRLVPGADTVLYYCNEKDIRIIPIRWNENDCAEKWVLHPCHLFFFRILSV